MTKFELWHFNQNGSKIFGTPNFGHSEFLPVFLHQNGLKQFGTPSFGCSKFLPVFLHQNVSKKFKMQIQFWPKFCVPNFFKTILVQKEWKKFGTVKIGCSNFFQTILVQNLEKFGTAKIKHSNLEWPKLGILNFLKHFG